MDQRHLDALEIKKAYEEAEKALAKVGKLLRTTEAGRYFWALRHRQAVSGMKAICQHLRFDVPGYTK